MVIVSSSLDLMTSPKLRQLAEFTVPGKNFPILSGLKFSKVAIGSLQNIGTTIASFGTSFLARHCLVPWHFS